jgi:hypothetical protein
MIRTILLGEGVSMDPGSGLRFDGDTDCLLGTQPHAVAGRQPGLVCIAPKTGASISFLRLSVMFERSNASS